jgi:glycosyltransferase involved in cell wall biosynthesis
MFKVSIITVTRNRPKLLFNTISSLQIQTSKEFEWIVINDGDCTETEKLVLGSELNFSFVYHNMPHPEIGFGLSYGRNIGLEMAKGKIITYLDDDNTFKPNYVADMVDFFDIHDEICFAMPIQLRRRDIIQEEEVVKQGKEFLSPSFDTTAFDLLNHRQLIDSNGFAHIQSSSPLLKWNPNLKIYIDYEFFLRCVCIWSADKFLLNPKILVDYVQTNLGIIGSSSYQNWIYELQLILNKRYIYSCLTIEIADEIDKLIDKYTRQGIKSDQIQAFAN